MTEVLVSPDVENAAVLYLRSGLGSLADKVATKVPATMPNSMVRVSLTGGSRSGIASDTVQLTIECWAADETAASDLARRSQGLMFAAAGSAAAGVFVRKVESVGGVQNFPDPGTTKPRYQFTVRWGIKPAAI